MGRRLLKMCGSVPSFLSRGVTAGVLSDEGKEECMMAVIRGRREGREARTRENGRCPSWQVVGLKVRMSLDKSVAEKRDLAFSCGRLGENQGAEWRNVTV